MQSCLIPEQTDIGYLTGRHVEIVGRTYHIIYRVTQVTEMYKIVSNTLSINVFTLKLVS